jgi:23S rRNA A1618 N6-methylase RlmF
MSCSSALSGSERVLEFTMCNPPFFSSLEGIVPNSASIISSVYFGKESVFLLVPWYLLLVACRFTIQLGVTSCCADIGQNAPHGCVDELITAGGELAFVTAMVRDSLQLRDRVGTQK